MSFLFTGKIEAPPKSRWETSAAEIWTYTLSRQGGGNRRMNEPQNIAKKKQQWEEDKQEDKKEQHENEEDQRKKDEEDETLRRWKLRYWNWRPINRAADLCSQRPKIHNRNNEILSLKQRRRQLQNYASEDAHKQVEIGSISAIERISARKEFLLGLSNKVLWVKWSCSFGWLTWKVMFKKHWMSNMTLFNNWLSWELSWGGCLTHRVISDKVHRLLVTLSYFRPDRFVQLLSLIPILILLLYLLVSIDLEYTCLLRVGYHAKKLTIFQVWIKW